MAAAAISDPLEELARDLEFARELTAGEEQAFHRFYEAYFPRVYGFVRKKLSNRADVEEVVQEVFLNIFVSIGSFRGDAPLAAWVFGVARRTGLRRGARRAIPVNRRERPAQAALAPEPAPCGRAPAGGAARPDAGWRADREAPGPGPRAARP